jgi:hypothetical protein
MRRQAIETANEGYDIPGTPYPDEPVRTISAPRDDRPRRRRQVINPGEAYADEFDDQEYDAPPPRRRRPRSDEPMPPQRRRGAAPRDPDYGARRDAAGESRPPRRRRRPPIDDI